MPDTSQAIPSAPGAPARTAASARVMAAGISLFSELGFLATSIRDLTKACGLTVGSFYNHFESKEALLYEIITEANSALEHDLDLLHSADLPPCEAIEGIVRTLVRFNLTNPREARVANREYVFLRSELRDTVIQHRRRVLGSLESALAAHLTTPSLVDSVNGSLSLEIRFLAISIVNLTISAPDWFRPEGPLTVDQVADAFCRLALRMSNL